MRDIKLAAHPSEIWKEKMKDVWRARIDFKHSEETKEKTRNSIKLHWIKRRENGMDKMSQESNKKRSESLRKTWAKRKGQKNEITYT